MSRYFVTLHIESYLRFLISCLLRFVLRFQSLQTPHSQRTTTKYKITMQIKYGYITRASILFRFCVGRAQLKSIMFKHGPRCQTRNATFQVTPSRNEKLLLLPEPFTGQSRTFWGVTVAFNQVDEERVRLAGPDRAAAEWVLKNEGAIKWTTSEERLDDYNFLPHSDFESHKLEEIDLSNTKVIDIGFDHLKDLKHLRKMKIYKCVSVMDDALERLRYVKDTLEHLEIIGCPMITDTGLNHLTNLRNLKTLILCDLQDVSDLSKSVFQLKSSMPWCDIQQTHYAGSQKA